MALGGHAGLGTRVLTTKEFTAAIGSVTATGAGQDMLGWDGCRFVISLGAMASGATFDAYVVRDDNSSFTSQTNITNAALTQVANTSNTNIFVIDVFRPAERYVRLIAAPGVANTTYCVTADRYRRGGILPPTQTALQSVTVSE